MILALQIKHSNILKSSFVIKSVPKNSYKVLLKIILKC